LTAETMECSTDSGSSCTTIPVGDYMIVALQDVDGNNMASTFVEDVQDGDELFIYGTGDALGVTAVAEKLIA
jgi:hypothetical protein